MNWFTITRLQDAKPRLRDKRTERRGQGDEL